MNILIILIILLIVVTFKNLREKFSKCPTNGFEPNYEPDKWNNNNYIQGSHNCYAYSLNDICPDLTQAYKNNKDDRNWMNPQPGHYCGMTKKVNYDETTCDKLKERILCDNPFIIETDCETVCPDKYYKIGLAVSPKTTYHFYRQNKDGTWSHKDGGREVTKLDASNNIITNPELSNRDFGYANYTNWCGYYCVPNDENIKTKYARNDYFEDKLWYSCPNKN